MPRGRSCTRLDLDRDGDQDIVINGSWYGEPRQGRWKARAFVRRKDWSIPTHYCQR